MCAPEEAELAPWRGREVSKASTKGDRICIFMDWNYFTFLPVIYSLEL